MAETLSTFSLKPGDAAPDFRLPKPDGSMHGLTEVAGEKGLLVAFVCNHCPYVVHLADALGDFGRECGELGVGMVAISSNDVVSYPQDGPDRMAEFGNESGWDFPYLFDEDQSVAKAYGAACTPDFFLFDGGLELFYAGQFDDSRPRNGKVVDGADLRSAVRAMVEGRVAPAKQWPSSGCSIKWIRGNEPPYFA